MFKHLLIPLDGSRLAEAALPPAACLARTLGAAVTLIHVIERNAPQEIHGQPHLTDPSAAAVYLDQVRARAFPAEVRVETHVHTTEVGNVARSLAEHAAELRPDLIVMCTHGRRGLRGWLFGSIAQQVVGLDATPVLLARPSETAAEAPFECRLLLVPLDGISAHEEGLCVGAGLAQACGAALHMVMVVPTLATLLGEKAGTGKLLPGATAAMLDNAQQGADEYLGRFVTQLTTPGLAVTSEVARGDPTTIIVDSAERLGASMIVMATHGKTGMNAFWSGSVAPKVLSRTSVPLLLVPVRDAVGGVG